jgi:alpha-beta hydrolase superfamily lysophospholipase
MSTSPVSPDARPEVPSDGVEQDILGPPYQRQTIDLGRDDEGPVVATLVSRRAATPTRNAVLYVHGFVDYFFQTHLADFYVERGWDFYAIDLRKYGRSLLPHQTPNFCRSLTEYFPELDEAARIIREQDRHDVLLVNAHSTGGLITPLWAHERRDRGLVDGLFLNSPFFDFNVAWLARRPAMAAITRLGRRQPYRIIPVGATTAYGRSLHADHDGEWRFDLTLKPLRGFGVRAGWLTAVWEGHRRIRAGLDIQVPVLVASSAASLRRGQVNELIHSADAVLDVAHMARWAPRLGRHVTLVRFDGGLHDLVLSPPAVRAKVFAELERWMGAYLPKPAPPNDAERPGRPAQSSEAAQPGRPAQSSEAAQPGRPAHPGEAAQPGRLTQPSEAAQPAEAARRTDREKRADQSAVR